jgi:tetratricopeptide (TPR) repeat protein
VQDTVSYWLALVAIAFAAFLLFKLVSSARRKRDDEAWRRYREAIDRAKRTGARHEKAEAYRDAARVALSELGRPNLAVSLARRADRLDPDGGEALDLLVASMSDGDRLRALERLLWRKLREVHPGSERHRKIFGELLALYQGPLKDPDRAEALRMLYPE